MLGHAPGDTLPGNCRVGDVAAVGHMVAASRLVGTQVVSSNDPSVRHGDEGLAVRSHPVGKSIRFAHVAWKRVGFTGTDCGSDNRPDGWGVIACGWSDQHRLLRLEMKFKPSYWRPLVPLSLA